MARPNDSIDIHLIGKVSMLYHHNGFTQQQIANRLQLSRPKVSRLLKEAKNRGFIQVSVNIPNGSYVELETNLEKKYGLDEVVITEISPLDNKSSDKLIKKQLGAAAAKYLQRTISQNSVLGLTWGTTLQAMVDEMQPVSAQNLHVVQTLGGVGPPEANTHAMDISRRLSQLLNSRLTLLPAPGIVESYEAKKVLLADRKVNAALNLFPKIKTAFVGIGALKTNPVLQKESSEISAKIQKELLESNAVGDIGLNFFDIDGNEVESEFQNLFIGMSLDELKKVETVVGIAGGDKKFDAIFGALNGQYVDVLITDHITANRLNSL